MSEGKAPMTEPNRYLAVFLGNPNAFESWSKLPEEEQRKRSQEGMAAWHAWVNAHAAQIVEMGGPLGKTKKISRDGVADIRNEMGGFTIVRAASHEEAARMFEKHPHFMIVPGDRVEVMPVMPVPGM